MSYIVRYIKINEINGEFILEEYTGGKWLGDTEMLRQGYTRYDGSEPVASLKVVDGVITPMTQEEIDARAEATKLQQEIQFYDTLKQNVDLVTVVGLYKALLDSVGLPYDATIDQMLAAAYASGKTTEELGQLETQLVALNKRVIVNLQWCNKYLGIEITNTDLMAWEDMPKMIQYFCN